MRCNDNSMFGISKSAKKAGMNSRPNKERLTIIRVSEWRGLKAESQIQKKNCIGMLNIYTKSSPSGCLVFLDNVMQHQFNSSLMQYKLKTNDLSFKTANSLPQNYHYNSHPVFHPNISHSFIYSLFPGQNYHPKIILIMSILFSKTLNCSYITEPKLSQTAKAFHHLTPPIFSCLNFPVSSSKLLSRPFTFVYLLFPLACFSLLYF